MKMAPQETSRSPRQTVALVSLLSVLYFIFGHLSFLVNVDNVLVTPVLFAPEGIALAFTLRYGPRVLPGVFAGQLALALSRGLPLTPALGISAGNSIEAVLAIVLFRAFRLDVNLRRARDLVGLLALVFLVLQPLSAALGNAVLWSSGLIANPSSLLQSSTNWWIGNAMGQTLVAPLLLVLFSGTRSPRQVAGDFLVPLAVILPVVILEEVLMRQTGIASLVVVLVPIVILLAIYRGMIAVCVGAIAIAASALYATSHNFGPFVGGGQAAILDLNVFLIGIALGGQFLSVFLERGRKQQKVEEELRAAREQLQRTAYELTENIPVGTYTMVQPPDGGMARFSFMSTRFLELTGLDHESAKANPMNAFACVHPDDHAEWVRKNAHTFQHKLPFKEECRIVVNGETRWITAESAPRDMPDGSVVWEGVLSDITDRKAAEDRTRKIEEQHRIDLETKLKTSLHAAAVAHEINQPLSAILLRSKIALEQGGAEREALSVVADEAQRVVATIEKMKTLLRNVQTEHRAIDLAGVVRSALLYNKGMLARHDVTVRDSGLDEEHSITGDDAQLQLAITNILRNAAEAIDQSAADRRVISVDVVQQDNEVILRIGDSGPGWSGAELAATPLTTTKKGGTGIGLYVARTAMENHRGRIGFGQSVFGGAEVRMIFPRAVW